MSLVELDELRHRLRITKKDLCERVELDPSTYTRWMRHVRGEPDGSTPQPRSLRAIRAALKEAAAHAVPSAGVPVADRPAA